MVWLFQRCCQWKHDDNLSICDFVAAILQTERYVPCWMYRTLWVVNDHSQDIHFLSKQALSWWLPCMWVKRWLELAKNFTDPLFHKDLSFPREAFPEGSNLVYSTAHHKPLSFYLQAPNLSFFRIFFLLSCVYIAHYINVDIFDYFVNANLQTGYVLINLRKTIFLKFSIFYLVHFSD